MAKIELSFGREAFGSDPANYDTIRPDYPDWVYATLVERCGLGPGAAVFDCCPSGPAPPRAGLPPRYPHALPNSSTPRTRTSKRTRARNMATLLRRKTPRPAKRSNGRSLTVDAPLVSLRDRRTSAHDHQGMAILRV